MSHEAYLAREHKISHDQKTILLAAFCIALIVFVESSIPYYIAQYKTPHSSSFLGQLTWTDDQNMYFSFIRQAYDGKLVFNNRLTSTPNGGAFINIQFLAVGHVMRLFHLSENSVYQAWRLAGALSLTFGFVLLSLIVLPTLSKRIYALCVFVFAGGFGIFFAFGTAIGLVSREVMQELSPDLRYGMFPFSQIMVNPHFSLPHGLVLIGSALFLLAEKRNHPPQLYIASGIVFLADGLIRPYDLISLFVVIPVFIITEAMRHFDPRASLLRTIPLVLASPALIYSIWLFTLHPIFKHWSQQGHVIEGMPHPAIFMFAFGIVGIFAIWRILQYKSQPFSVQERFLFIWFVGIFFCAYLGRVIPALGFSPQISIPLFAPLVLFAFSLRLPFRRYRNQLIAMAVLLVIIGNIGILASFSKRFIQDGDVRDFYATDDETAALRWLNKTAKEQIVLALPPVSGRICKYTSASTVLGHYSVTPNFRSTEQLVLHVLRAHQFTPNELQTLHDLGARYVFVGPTERRFLGFDPNVAHGLLRVFSQGAVAIYKVDLQRHGVAGTGADE